MTTTNQSEASSSGADNGKHKDINLRDLRGIVAKPEAPVSVKDMNNAMKDAMNEASGLDDQGGER